MTIKELIIDPAPAAQTDAAKVSASKKKAEPEYEVAICSGCDFAIRRKTPKTSKLLVIMPSQQLYYIKDENTSATEALPRNDRDLIASALKMFLRPDVSVALDCSWLPVKVFNRDMIPVVSKVISEAELAKKAKENTLQFVRQYGSWEPLRVPYGMNESLWRWVADNTGTDTENLYQYAAIANTISGTFGIENAKDFITRLISVTDKSDRLSGVLFALNSLLESGVYNYKSFAQYVLYNLPWQGFIIRNGIDVWKDYLYMAGVIGVKEKYPQNLFQAHARVQRVFRERQEQIQIEQWDKASAKMKPYEYEGSKFKIISPKNPIDMETEAAQQHNCLKSYIERVAEGREMIFFLRRKDAPDDSLVTIEVLNNGTVGQVYAAENRVPKQECLDFVSEWARAKNLKYED